jgi:hypothetical protein
MEKNYMGLTAIIMQVVRMPEYYDYVLGVVPLALIGLTGVLRVAGVDLLVAVPVGAATAGLAVGHALFINGPVEGATDASVDDSPARSPSSPASATDRPPANAD